MVWRFVDHRQGRRGTEYSPLFSQASETQSYGTLNLEEVPPTI